MEVVEVPPSPPIAIPSDFKSDRIVGILIIVVGGLFLCSGFYVIFLGNVLSTASDQMALQAVEAAKKTKVVQGPSTGLEEFPAKMGSLMYWAGWIAIALALLQVASGIGVYRSSRKGLVFALVVAGLSLLGNGFGLVVGVGIGLYVILRLWGNVGPKPV